MLFVFIIYREYRIPRAAVAVAVAAVAVLFSLLLLVLLLVIINANETCLFRAVVVEDQVAGREVRLRGDT